MCIYTLIYGEGDRDRLSPIAFRVLNIRPYVTVCAAWYGTICAVCTVRTLCNIMYNMQ